MESKYIQFPPLPLDTPVECIEMAWLFVHLSKQDKEIVHEFLVENLKEDDRDIGETVLVYQNYCIEKKSMEDLSKEFGIDKKAVELMTQYYDKKWC